MFEVKYCIKTRYGRELWLSAREIHERAKKDIRFDQHWNTTISEIIRISSKPNFPKEYAEAIKIAILNSYAKIEGRSYISSQKKDNEALNYCYNSLANTTEEAEEARQNYLKAVIKSCTKYELFDYKHDGPTYDWMCEKWQEENFEKHKKQATIEIDQLKKKLETEFEDKMNKAKEQGIFKQDNEENQEAIKNQWETILKQ